MKGRFALLVFSLFSNFVVAQVEVDSIGAKSLSEAKRLRIDSIPRLSVASVSDSIAVRRLAYQKIDSVRLLFNNAADSINTVYANALSTIDAETSKINARIDSLQPLRLDAGEYAQRLDSLKQLKVRTQSLFSSQLEALKAKTVDKLMALDLPPEYKESLQHLTQKLDQININTGSLKIPELDVPNFSLPKVDDVGNLTAKVKDLGNLGKDFSLSKIEAPSGDLQQVTQQATGYQEDLKNITQGNLNDAKALPETIEDQATKIDGIQELQKQSSIIDGHKGQLAELQAPDAAKAKAVAVVKKAAVNHFAGKQEQLKAAMQKISKYKQKYASVSSIKDLAKRPPNAMKGKPLIERLNPGLYLQYQRKTLYLLDLNPYVGYKISGRFTAGVGWNHRYAYNRDSRGFTTHSRIYGPRGYVDTKLGKGFIIHLEVEAMNAFVPSTLSGNPDRGGREWVCSFMTGLKKEHKIYKNLKGTALIQYNWLNHYFKTPYIDRLNSRIGFEYMLKRKSAKNRQS